MGRSKFLAARICAKLVVADKDHESVRGSALKHPCQNPFLLTRLFSLHALPLYLHQFNDFSISFESRWFPGLVSDESDAVWPHRSHAIVGDALPQYQSGLGPKSFPMIRGFTKTRGTPKIDPQLGGGFPCNQDPNKVPPSFRKPPYSPLESMGVEGPQAPAGCAGGDAEQCTLGRV